MTAPARLAALSCVLLLALAPAAGAATSAAASGTTLIVSNDGGDEAYGVALKLSGDPEYQVTTTNDIIATVPAGCSLSGANKVLSCPAAAGYTLLRLTGGAGKETVTISGSDQYGYDYNTGLTVDGKDGDDTFIAGTGGALLSPGVTGGPGNDTFTGSPDAEDSFTAEAGDDLYTGGTRAVPAGFSADSYQRRYADDQWYADGDAPVRLSQDGSANDTDGQGGTDNVTGIESVFTGQGDDVLEAGPGAVSFESSGGNDTLTGSPGADSLFAGAGNDRLAGGGGEDDLDDGDFEPAYRMTGTPPPVPGNDTLDGGDGDDELGVNAGADDVRGGNGTDTLITSRIDTQVVDGFPDAAASVPRFRPLTISLDDQPNDGPTGASEGDNIRSDVENLNVGGFGGPRMRSARAAFPRSDLAVANDAPDMITGSDAPNVITTGAGNDTVDGGGGADTLRLGDGDDSASTADRVTDIVACGLGTDSVVADLPGTNAPRADALTDCENVSGTPLGLEGGTLPVAPALTLGGRSNLKAKAFLKRWTVGVGVTSDQPVTAAGELTTTRATIARVGALSIGAGKLASGTGRRTLRLKVVKKFRKKLKRKLRTKRQRRKGIKLVAVVTVTNADGQAKTARRTIKIKG